MTVLLIFEGFEWILGQMAEAICKNNTPDISFIYSDTSILKHDQEEFKSLVRQVDVVHWITNAAHAQPQETVRWSLTSFPSVASLYHVALGEESKIQTASLASCIHVMSNEWHDYMVDVAGVSSAKVHTIPLGVDTSFWRFRQKPTNKRGPFRIGCFGNPRAPNERKGADVLLHAMSLLNQEDYQLVLAGPGWEDHIRGMSHLNIKNYGYVERKRLRKLYYSLDLYVIPSRIEGGPVTLLEACAVGIPTVSTPVGMSKDVLDHGVNGFLVPKDSAETMARQIQQVRASTNINEMRLKARSRAEEYDWRHVAPQFGSLYRKVLNQYPQKSLQNSKSIKFHGRMVTPREQREAVLAEKRHRHVASMLQQRNFRAAVDTFFRLPASYWPFSVARLVKRALRLTK